MGAADLSGNGAAEVFVGGYLLNSSLKILDQQSGTLVYDASKKEPYVSTAFGDADADGRVDLVIGTNTTHLVDRQSGQTKREFVGTPFAGTPGGPPEPWGLSEQQLSFVQLGPDAALELVVARYNFSGLVAHVLDGETGE